jgi:single-stranded DNA-binding protein
MPITTFSIITGGKSIKDKNGFYKPVENSGVFINVSVFGDLAVAVANANIGKRTRISVAGNIYTQVYTFPQDHPTKAGTQSKTTNLTANSISVEIVPPKPANSNVVVEQQNQGNVAPSEQVQPQVDPWASI